MERLCQDIRYTLRTARHAPGFVLLVTLTLALGIGGTTALESFVSGILLKPLPYSDPATLVSIKRNNRKQGFQGMMMLSRDIVSIQEQIRSLSSLSGYVYSKVNLSGDESPERVNAAHVLPDLMSLLGIEPALGRSFRPEEHKTEQPIVILDYALWLRRFGGEPGVLGRELRINGVVHVIVGVLPRGRELTPSDVDLLVPMSAEALRGELILSLWVLARLSKGVDVGVADDEVNAILRRWEEENRPPVMGWGADVTLLREAIVGEVATTLLVLLGAVALVLLIACANVANLLLVRGVAREKELAIRAAMGATRGRIAKQLLTESVLLSLVGGTLGVLLAIGATRLLLVLAPSGIPRIDEVSVDAPVLAFAVAVSISAGLLSGIFPAFGLSHYDLDGSLKPTGRTMTASADRRRFRTVLAVAQVALALTLSISAGLMIRSFVRLVSVDLGFDAGGVLTMNISLPGYRYVEPHESERALIDILEQVGALPDVLSVAASGWAPMTGSWARAQMSVEATSGDIVEREKWPMILGVTPDYFRVLGVPLHLGRDFTYRDRYPETADVVVNARLAEGAWPGEDPIGKRLKFGGADSENPWFTVVGVAGDARLVGLALEEQEGMFMPLLRTDLTLSFVQLAVRTRSEPADAVATIRDAIWEIDEELPMSDVQTMDELVSKNVSRPRFNLAVLGVFAGVAIVLATIGIYGVISHNVTQRSQEIGLRMALGADRSAVLRLVMGRGLLLVLAGLGAGLFLAISATRLLTSFLYEVSATDSTTFIAASLLLGGTGLAATLLPALRATRVDPMTTLRSE